MYIVNLANFFKVDMADPDTLLTDEEVALVRERLMEKVGGTLEYPPWRGMLTRWLSTLRNVG